MNIIVILLLTGILFSVNGQDTLYNESFNPGVLLEPEPDWPIVINPFIHDSSTINRLIGEASPENLRDGYRIQVLTTKIASEAESLRNTIAPMISDSIHITYEVPNYKVRIGDFINRREAEDLQVVIKDLGYRSAWIVRTRVELRE